MTRPGLLVLCAMLTLGGAQDLTAQTLDESFEIAQNRSAGDIVANLEAQGYAINRISQTMLGRTKIVATNAFHTREVVVSRTTGEVLSDTVNNPPHGGERAPLIEFGGKVTFTWNWN